MARTKKPRTSITLADPQKVRLDRLSTKTGLYVSEHVRRAIDAYLPEAEREAELEPLPPAPAAEPPA